MQITRQVLGWIGQQIYRKGFQMFKRFYGSLLGGGNSNNSNVTALGTKLDPMHYLFKSIIGIRRR